MNRWDKFGLFLLAIGALGLLVALIISMGEIESIVASGPIIAGVGSALFGIALVRKAWLAAWCGLLLLFMVLTIFGIIWFSHWGPGDARLPVPLIGLGFFLVYVYIANRAYRHWPRRDEPWRCSGCGYALVGLSGRACPECGKRFDPAKVPAELPQDVILDS